MRSLETRVRQIEKTTGAGRAVIVWVHHGETDDQAMTRWKAEHPGEDLERPGLRVMLMGWGDPQEAV